MDKYKLFDLLAPDNGIATASTEVNAQLLADLLNDYPYFQTAHLLLSSRLKAEGNVNDRVLARAATHINNRETLYKMMRRAETHTTSAETTANNTTMPVFAVDNQDKPTEAIPLDHLDDILTRSDDDNSDKPTEIVSVADVSAMTDAPNADTDDVMIWIKKSQTQLQEIADQNENKLPLGAYGILTEPPLPQTDNALTNTDRIETKARQQVEIELQQIKEIQPPLNEPPTDTTDLTAMLERESREVIRRDVEKDLEQMKMVFPTADNATENEEIAANAESDQLIQSLREKVETYKKEKHINEESLPFLSETDSAAIQTLVAEQQDTQIPDGDGDDDVVDLGTTIAEQTDRNWTNTESILSETMARVYARQGYIEKAIQIYEQLTAKYPEKSAYFAEKIEKMR